LEPGPADGIPRCADFVAGIMECVKGFSFPLLFSLQQRQASHLKFAVYSSVAATGKKTTYGTATLDTSSFLGLDDTVMPFLLPVFRSVSSSGDKEVGAYLVVALQYNGASTEQDLEECARGLLRDMIMSLHVDRLPLPLGSPAALLSPKVGATVLHVALGQLQLASAVLDAGDIIYATVRCNPADDMKTILTNVPAGSADAERVVWPTCGAVAVPVDQSLAATWERPDVTVTSHVHETITPTVTLALYRGKRVTDAGSAFYRLIDPATAVCLGEATVVLQRVQLALGLPINVSMPVRSSDGFRVAMVQISVQKTTLTDAAPAAAAADPMALTVVAPSPAPAAAAAAGQNVLLPLVVQIDEGSVTDPQWRQPIEPLFELTVLTPRDGMDMPPGAVWRARTGFVRTGARGAKASGNQDAGTGSAQAAAASAAASAWGLQCVLTVPRDGFPASAADEMSKPTWALAVVCRDAAREGCPAVATARLALPWSLLVRGRALDQWAVLANPNGASSADSYGRVHVVVTGGGDDGPKVYPAAADEMYNLKALGQGHAPTGPPPALAATLTQLAALYPPRPPQSLPLVKDANSVGLGAMLVWINAAYFTRGGVMSEGLTIVMAAATCRTPANPALSSSSNNTGGGSKGGKTIEIDADDDGARATFAATPFAVLPINGGDVPCCALPVTGASAEVRLDVSAQYNKTPFTGRLSTLTGLTKCEGAAAFDPTTESAGPATLFPTALANPSRDLMLAPDTTGPGRNSTGLRGSIPQVSLATTFVPYVTGNLVVCCRWLRVHRDVQSRKLPDGRPHRLALRCVMSSASYGYTKAIDIPLGVPFQGDTAFSERAYFTPNGVVPGEAAAGDANKGPPARRRRYDAPAAAAANAGTDKATTDPSAFIVLPVDTLELVARGDLDGMLNLQLTLVDVDEAGAQYVVGTGAVDTATLYYQALRSASAAEPSKVAAGEAIGASPWLTVTIAPLYG
jgi:hypothetical protein